MRVTEHRVGEGAYGVTVAADGAVWATLTGSGELVRLGVAGDIERIRLDSQLSRPMVIAAGADGAVWFSRGDGVIGRVDPGGVICAQPVGADGGSPYGICLGPDGRTVWYTLVGTDKAGRIAPDGQLDEFAMPEGSMPSLIASGPDGALWITLNQANAIARMTVDGELAIFPVPTPGAAPVGISASRDEVWFAEIGAGQIGRMTPEGKVTEFPLPDRSSCPHAVANAGDGCWATLWATSALVHIGPYGQIIEVAEFDADGEPHGVALAADQSVWVALEKGTLAHVTPGP